jgi:chorismate mutase
MNKDSKNRLEYLRKQIKNENISYGEIAELQSLRKHIDKNDIELLQWAGVKE